MATGWALCVRGERSGDSVGKAGAGPLGGGLDGPLPCPPPGIDCAGKAGARSVDHITSRALPPPGTASQDDVRLSPPHSASSPGTIWSEGASAAPSETSPKVAPAKPALEASSTIARDACLPSGSTSPAARSRVREPFGVESGYNEPVRQPVRPSSDVI